MVELEYASFDREIDNLLALADIILKEGDYCGVQELMFDIMSLQSKASRLCSFADCDYAMQQVDITHSRAGRNVDLCNSFQSLMVERFSPFVLRFIDDVCGAKLPPASIKSCNNTSLSTFIPRLTDVISLGENNNQAWQEIQDKICMLEKMMKKNFTPTVFPGLRNEEKLWRVLQLYLYMSYLQYHFVRVVELSTEEIQEDDYGRMLLAMINAYCESEEGRLELERYECKLIYDNDNNALSLQQLKDARKALVSDVPQSLQLCFMNNVSNLQALAKDMVQSCVEADDLTALIAAIAKWQRLTWNISEMMHPDESQSIMHNEVFHTMLHDKPVRMQEIKVRIERMLSSVTKKNHWFCVWCVLKHHNLLQETGFEQYARQMMHRDWFADIDESLRFKGDTLRDYNGYLTLHDYTRWNEKEFLSYKELYNKKKWSSSLCGKFYRLCCEMDEAFRS